MDETLTPTPPLSGEPQPKRRKISKPMLLLLLILLLIVFGFLYFQKITPNFSKDQNVVLTSLKEAPTNKLVPEFPPQLIILPGTEIIESKLMLLPEGTKSNASIGNWYAFARITAPVSLREATSSYKKILTKLGYSYSKPTTVTTGRFTIKAQRLNEVTKTSETVQVFINGDEMKSDIILSYSNNTQK